MATHSRTLPRKCHRWRSLVGYSPWGHKESDTTSLSLLVFRVLIDEILIGVDKIWMVGEGDCFRCIIKGMIWGEASEA